MGLIVRVRMASFFAGAAFASIPALYILYKDYNFALHSFSDQMKLVHNSLDQRVSALETFKEVKVAQQVEAIE